MNKIESIENKDSFGDFFWVHIRGYLFIILTLFSITAMLNMTIHYNTEIVKSDIESIKYCPHCGQEILR